MSKTGNHCRIQALQLLLEDESLVRSDWQPDAHLLNSALLQALHVRRRGGEQ